MYVPFRWLFICLLPGVAALQGGDSASLARLPLRFEPNVGQAAQDVRYVARGAGYTMLLSGGKTVMLLSSPRPEPAVLGTPQRNRHGESPAVVTTTLVGASAASSNRPEQPLSSISNYYSGGDPKRWHPGVANYGRVRFNRIYSGIDLVYYGNQQQLDLISCCIRAPIRLKSGYVTPARKR